MKQLTLNKASKSKILLTMTSRKPLLSLSGKIRESDCAVDVVLTDGKTIFASSSGLPKPLSQRKVERFIKKFNR